MQAPHPLPPIPHPQNNNKIYPIFQLIHHLQPIHLRALELSVTSPHPRPRGWARVVPMSHPPIAPPPQPGPPEASPLYKQNSWSSDTSRDEAWLRRKGNHGRRRRTKSLTDEDLDELKACIELGFGFDSPEMDKRLSDTFPAYGLYYAVNKHYNETVSKRPSLSSPLSSTISEEDTPPSPLGSPHTIVGPGDNPQTVKTRLRQWAQVVACAVRQSSC